MLSSGSWEGSQYIRNLASPQGGGDAADVVNWAINCVIDTSKCRGNPVQWP